MATFITTFKFTEQGLRAIHDSPKRASAFKSAAKKLGIKVLAQYWTLGACDGVIICDAPDDETVAAAMLQVTSLGNVNTTTVRAFNANEFEKVVGMVGK